jgi:REP element-mobilizing transposase RayT
VGRSSTPIVEPVPRPPSLQIPGAAYHITARAVYGRPLFPEARDCDDFLTLLGKVVYQRDWVCGAYCLMTTHYHLVIRTPEADLARGIQSLNACYAQQFNRRHGLEGHVFLRRYQSVMIEREAHLLELGRYLPTNPVRAGLCARAEDWPWSSYAALLGLCAPPAFLSSGWLLGLFGRDRQSAARRLRAFVEDVS